MKQLTRLTILLFACAGLALTAWAGPVSSGKEMKQVAPVPAPECNWTGFYIGLNVGGQFGHSESHDPDPGYTFDDKPWGFSESGVIAGGQVGYNYQWNWLVVGIEADLGYLNVEGDGAEPGSGDNDTVASTSSDFYTTIRGRLGLAWNHWLFYGTGGAIGLNYDTRVDDNCSVFPCGPDTIHAHKEDFNWGWTAGGGIEYMLNCHWTIKTEYLYFQTDDQTPHGIDAILGNNYGFETHTFGHIVRAGLNYKF